MNTTRPANRTGGNTSSCGKLEMVSNTLDHSAIGAGPQSTDREVWTNDGDE